MYPVQQAHINTHATTHISLTHTTHTTCLQYIPFHNLINYDAHTTCEFSLMEDRRRFCFCLLDLWPHYLVETMIIFALSLSLSFSRSIIIILFTPHSPFPAVPYISHPWICSRIQYYKHTRNTEIAITPGEMKVRKVQGTFTGKRELSQS